MLVVESYQEQGLKFDEAIAELAGKLADPGEKPKRGKRAPNPVQEQNSMAALQAAMAGTSFRGPRG